MIKMLKLEFNIFQKVLEKDKMNGHFPTIHCMNGEDRFIFVIRSREKWVYYTEMLYLSIVDFAEQEGQTPDEAFDLFTLNYCSNTLPIEEVEYTKMREEIEELPEATHIGNQDDSVQSFKHFTTSLLKELNDVVQAGDDLIDSAQSYSDFLNRYFDSLERKTIKAARQIDVDLDKSFLNKTLGSFLKDLFNSVNTIAFANQVRRFIKGDLVAGLDSSEAELGIDIGFTDTFIDKLNILASQQIDGYTINGKKWPGIKGVTKEIQATVIRTVQGGLKDNKSLDEITSDIKGDFDKFSGWRSEMIARTETTRITNEGKLLGYKESGLKGEKVWSAAQPRGCKGCSEICDRMDGQAVPLDSDFVDPGTGKRYASPPGHPNCKSTIFFKTFAPNKSGV